MACRPNFRYGVAIASLAYVGLRVAAYAAALDFADYTENSMTSFSVSYLQKSSRKQHAAKQLFINLTLFSDVINLPSHRQVRAASTGITW
jgi:hypothetical protein